MRTRITLTLSHFYDNHDKLITHYIWLHNKNLNNAQNRRVLVYDTLDIVVQFIVCVNFTIFWLNWCVVINALHFK